MVTGRHRLARRTLLAAAAAATASRLLPFAAAAEVPLRFVWDWTPQGFHGIWALAEERGMFRAEGLQVRQDPGAGSGDTIVKVASGAYDIGLADVNSLVKFNAENPDRRVMAVCMIFNRTPAAVTTLRSTGIRTAADLAGRRIGSPEGEASRMLFPVYAAATGLDPASVHWTSMAANLRETMLRTGQVDAIAGFQLTTIMNLLAIGVPRGDIVVLPFADAGVDLYGSALVVSAKWAPLHADALRGFLRATIGGLRVAINEPDAAIAAMKRREPLLDTAIESQRWALTRETTVVTEDVRREGLGTMTAERMAKVIEVNARINNVANPPTLEQMYTDDYLPPPEQRRL